MASVMLLAPLVIVGLASCRTPLAPLGKGPIPLPKGEATGPKAPPASRFVAPQAYHAFMDAEIAAQLGDRQAARQHFSRALVEDPESPELRLRLAELASEEGDTAAALRLARDARRVDPRYPRSYLVEARLLRRRAPHRARILLRRALALDPRKADTFLWLAPLERRINGVRAEGHVFKALLRVHPENLEGLLGLARVHAREGRLGEAEQVLRRAIGAHPFATDPWLQLARIRILQGRWEDATSWLYRGLEATGDDHLLVEELFRLWMAEGRPERARDLVELLRGHQSGPALTLAAILMDRLGEPVLAEENLRLALDQDPSHGPAYVHLSRLRRWQGDTQGALRLLEEVRPEAEAWSATQVELARYLEEEGLSRAAEERLLAVLGSRPMNPLALESLAFLRARGGRMEAALEALDEARRALGEGEDEPGYRYVLLLLLEDGGRWSEASRLAREQLQEDPDDPLVHNVLGYGLAERGLEPETASRHLRWALRLDPINPHILDSLGWALAKQGQLATAIPLLERAVRVDRRLCEGWMHLGQVLGWAGQGDRARRALERALGCATSPSARAMLLGRLGDSGLGATFHHESWALRARARSFR